MKIQPVHYQAIKAKFVANLAKFAEHRAFLLSPENKRPAKDIEMRLRWDALNQLFGAKYICDTLYPYLNDTHIDSALRNIMAEIEAAHTAAAQVESILPD